MAQHDARERVLGIDVRSSRFGFAVFEGPDLLLDFGARSYGKYQWQVEATVRKRFEGLVDLYSPSLIVLRLGISRDADGQGRLGVVMRTFKQCAKLRAIRIQFVSRERMKKNYRAQSLPSKHHIASFMARRFSDLARYLPRPRNRKPWKKEPYHMTVFDAVAAVVATFQWPPAQMS